MIVYSYLFLTKQLDKILFFFWNVLEWTQFKYLQYKPNERALKYKLKTKDINKKEHRADKLALEEANILYDDIEWSFKKIVSGKYVASGKKQKKFSRVYKYGDFNEFNIKSKK